MNRRTTLSLLAAVPALGLPRIARAADTHLELGTMGADGSAEPFYGLDHGFFKDAGLDVKVTVMNNTAQLASAVAAGALEIGYGSVIPVAQAHLHGIEFRLIAPALVYTSPALTNVIMTGNTSGINTAADLSGKTVAVNGLRDLTQYEMQGWIEQNGGDITKVKLIEIPFSEMGTALETNRVAAAIFAEPFATGAAAQAHVIGNGSEAVGKHYMVTGWFATPDWLTKNASVARRLQTTMLKIARWANANHAETQPIILKYTKVRPDVAAKMLRSTYGDAPVDPAIVQPAIDIAVKYGNMPHVNAADLIWRG